MNGTFGSEFEFLRSVVGGNSDPRATMLRYGALVGDVSRLLASVANSASAAQVLAGMINQRQLVALSAADIECSPRSTPSAEFEDYLRLGICCNGTFLHDLVLDAATVGAFAASNVSQMRPAEIDYPSLMFAEATNAVRSWLLREGGQQQPGVILKDHLIHAKKIVVYDPYFGNLALKVMQDIFSELYLSGPIESKTVVLIGRGDGGLSEGDIAQGIHGYFSDPVSDLEISKCQKAPGIASNVHDRYIQVDSSHTFVFSAGIGCFYGSGGRNRASTVVMNDLFISYEEVAVTRSDGGGLVRIRY